MCNKCKNGDTPRAVHFNGNFQNRRPDIPNDGTNLCIDRNGESTCLPSSWKVLLMEEIRLTSWGWYFSHYLQGFIHPRWLFGISSINSSIGNPLISWHSFRPLTLRSMPGMLGDSQPFTGLHTRRGSHIFCPVGGDAPWYLSLGTYDTVGGRNPAPLFLHPKTNPRTPSLNDPNPAPPQWQKAPQHWTTGFKGMH